MCSEIKYAAKVINCCYYQITGLLYNCCFCSGAAVGSINVFISKAPLMLIRQAAIQYRALPDATGKSIQNFFKIGFLFCTIDKRPKP